MQAEDDRIAQEIQNKREKEGRDSELEKHKMMVSCTFQPFFRTFNLKIIL
jgi:hypothetical protein